MQDERNRSLPLRSVANARELGGYPACDGRHVRSGLLLRTAHLGDICAKDIGVLTDRYHVETVIDFRMEMEMKGFEDPAVDGVRYHHLDVIDLQMLPDIKGSEDIDFGRMNLAEMVRFSEMAGMMDERMYIGFLSNEKGKRAFERFFRILLDASPDRAVLWHCTGGKDRTGIAAMLLLSVFGSDEETILYDYLLTNRYNAARIAGTKQHLHAAGYDDAFCEKAVLLFDGVDERYMRRALAFLNQRYGSVLGYIRDELGISDDEMDTLRAKYLA